MIDTGTDAQSDSMALKTPIFFARVPTSTFPLESTRVPTSAFPLESTRVPTSTFPLESRQNKVLKVIDANKEKVPYSPFLVNQMKQLNANSPNISQKFNEPTWFGCLNKMSFCDNVENNARQLMTPEQFCEKKLSLIYNFKDVQPKEIYNCSEVQTALFNNFNRTEDMLHVCTNYNDNMCEPLTIEASSFTHSELLNKSSERLAIINKHLLPPSHWKIPRLNAANDEKKGNIYPLSQIELPKMTFTPPKVKNSFCKMTHVLGSENQLDSLEKNLHHNNVKNSLPINAITNSNIVNQNRYDSTTWTNIAQLNPQSVQSVSNTFTKKSMTDVSTQKYILSEELESKFNHEDLMPFGVFWDIENVAIPKTISATQLVKNIRHRFMKTHWEADFFCATDTSSYQMWQTFHELYLTGIDVCHVAPLKNAADQKLENRMRRFSNAYGSSATIVLITSDKDFEDVVRHLRHTAKHNVILVHRPHCSEALKNLASQTIPFADIVNMTLPPEQEKAARDVFKKRRQMWKNKISTWTNTDLRTLLCYYQSQRFGCEFTSSPCENLTGGG